MIDQPNQPITRDTKFLSLDVESNGLQGEGFAVGAVLIQADGTVLDEFLGRAPIKGELDPWVKANVLPPMQDVPEDYKSTKALRGGFWRWFTTAKEEADYVLVDNGYPVEARFLIACQEDDLDARYWGHAYPMLELNSLLLQVGVKPLAVRYKLVAEQLAGQQMLKHNPRFDAEVSARTALWALERSGQLK